MARTVNLRMCLDALLPAFHARLAEAGISGRKEVKLVLSDGREEAGVRWDGTAVTVGDAFPAKHRLDAGDRLATLLLGGDAPEDVLDLPDVEASTEQAEELARILFPEQFPMLSKPDRF